MGNQLIGRPVSQRFDPSFQSTGFPTLRTASSASNPLMAAAMSSQMGGAIQSPPPPQQTDPGSNRVVAGTGMLTVPSVLGGFRGAPRFNPIGPVGRRLFTSQ